MIPKFLSGSLPDDHNPSLWRLLSLGLWCLCFVHFLSKFSFVDLWCWERVIVEMTLCTVKIGSLAFRNSIQGLLITGGHFISVMRSELQGAVPHEAMSFSGVPGPVSCCLWPCADFLCAGWTRGAGRARAAWRGGHEGKLLWTVLHICSQGTDKSWCKTSCFGYKQDAQVGFFPPLNMGMYAHIHNFS